MGRIEVEQRGDEGGVESTRHASDLESCIKSFEVTKSGTVVSPLDLNARVSREPGKNIQICRKQGRGFLGRIMGGFAERTE